MVLSNTVTGVDGTVVPLQTDTICLHGDGAHAVEFAKALHVCFRQNNIHLKTFGS
jgi:UPF0271 protein